MSPIDPTADPNTQKRLKIPDREAVGEIGLSSVRPETKALSVSLPMAMLASSHASVPARSTPSTTEVVRHNRVRV